MTDGPFRNAVLSCRWKRFGEMLVSEAASVNELRNQACHSMLGDVNVAAFGELLADLSAHAERRQSDFYPLTEVESIFQNHTLQPLVDDLQRHLTASLLDKIPLTTAIEHALSNTLMEWIRIAKNRLDEECVRALALGDMKPSDYHRAIERNREAFSIVNATDLCIALVYRNKRAFGKAVMRTGIDEGPEE